MNKNFDINEQKGWLCPRCNIILAPHMNCCIFCNGNNETTIAIGIIKTDPKFEVSYKREQHVNDRSK